MQGPPVAPHSLRNPAHQNENAIGWVSQLSQQVFFAFASQHQVKATLTDSLMHTFWSICLHKVLFFLHTKALSTNNLGLRNITTISFFQTCQRDRSHSQNQVHDKVHCTESQREKIVYSSSCCKDSLVGAIQKGGRCSFEKTRGAREPKSKPLVEKTKCVRFESCGGWSKFLVPATDIHSQKQL